MRFSLGASGCDDVIAYALQLSLAISHQRLLTTDMHIFSQLLSAILHLDAHLAEYAASYGGWIYGILFAIIFAETGLVIAPILPGDSLIFAASALAARGSLSIGGLFVLFAVAAIGGDALNYWIGRRIGARLLANEHSRILKKSYVEKTQAFYARYGNKTIVLARFVPIVRTFAPFIAGVGKMDYAQFLKFNVIGGLVWVALFTALGYFFGNLAVVKDHFSLVILGIIALSLLAPAWEILKARKEKSA